MPTFPFRVKVALLALLGQLIPDTDELIVPPTLFVPTFMETELEDGELVLQLLTAATVIVPDPVELGALMTISFVPYPLTHVAPEGKVHV